MAEGLSPEEANKKKANMQSMETEEASQKSIEEDIRRQGMDVGCTTFAVNNQNQLGEKAGEDNKTIVEFVDGKVAESIKVLVPIEGDMSLPAKELTEKTKKALQARAKKSKEAHEKEDEEATRE